MKGATSGANKNPISSGDSSSSSPDSDTESDHSCGKKSLVNRRGVGKRKCMGIGFEALRKHGYKGGMSVLNLPAPKEEAEKKQEWSWGTGREKRDGDAYKEVERESYEEREKTRGAVRDGEVMCGVTSRREREEREEREKTLSFSQKEKRKRDMGQTSRGKSYVEEEKRLLRDCGIYSGFDS